MAAPATTTGYAWGECSASGRALVVKPEQCFEFPLPKVEGNFFYPNSEGLYYEIMAVQRCLLAGLTECPQAPLAESVVAIEAICQSVEQIVSCAK
jgi:hypothetical protein